jgi:hypothetical protein
MDFPSVVTSTTWIVITRTGSSSTVNAPPTQSPSDNRPPPNDIPLVAKVVTPIAVLLFVAALMCFCIFCSRKSRRSRESRDHRRHECCLGFFKRNYRWHGLRFWTWQRRRSPAGPPSDDTYGVAMGLDLFDRPPAPPAPQRTIAEVADERLESGGKYRGADATTQLGREQGTQGRNLDLMPPRGLEATPKLSRDRPAQDSNLNQMTPSPPADGTSPTQELASESPASPHQSRQAGWRAGVPVAFPDGPELRVQLKWTGPREKTDSRE